LKNARKAIAIFVTNTAVRGREGEREKENNKTIYVKKRRENEGARKREKGKMENKKKYLLRQREKRVYTKKPLRLLIVFFSQVCMYCRQTSVWIMSNHTMRLKI